MVNLLALGMVFVGTWINAFASLMLKAAAQKFNLNPFEQIKNKKLIIGTLMFAVSTIFYLAALRLDNLSIIYPLTSLTYIWVTFLSNKKLGESLRKSKLAGILLIVIGIILINVFSAAK
jgi:uncharacterized membrane protein